MLCPLLQLDPLDQRRIAFSLSCNWSGVLDLSSGQITHLYAPPGALQARGAAMRVSVHATRSSSACVIDLGWDGMARR